MELRELRERIYAGVLGKIIGVYLGRPVEGWSYEAIRERFGEIVYYPHRAAGVPLIVADDDISGTFAFFRAMEDHGCPADLSAREIGETWLNYIIEDKTILWWGGPGRSTEHTAYLNLKNGIPAPESGSIARNGRAVAEQIGAQIFIEGFAMCYPGDPEKTAALVRKAASVSHDGLAVDAACHLAALDALAFQEERLETLLDEAFRFIREDRLRRLVSDVREFCAAEGDWRKVREKLDVQYGYRLYPGSCHIAPNHAMVLAALLCGGDDFQRAVSIAASAGWDTDCNAGNVGALNGIRLGLRGIDAGGDLRTEAADRLLVITSDGGEAVSDAVRETRNIVRAACRLNGWEEPAPRKRFSFDYPGSLQGFAPCPYSDGSHHGFRLTHEEGRLAVRCAGVGRGLPAEFSTPTFLEFEPAAGSYLSEASPTLYETQTIRSHTRLKEAAGQPVRLQMYVVFREGNAVRRAYSDAWTLEDQWKECVWTVPSLEGGAILRMGFSVSSDARFSGTVWIGDAGWEGPPRRFAQSGVLMGSIWDLLPEKLRMWTSSAKCFSADGVHTYSIAQAEGTGLATLGTRDWFDYTVKANLTFSLHEAAGLAMYCRGHRRYYAARFREGRRVEIVLERDGETAVLAECVFPYEQDRAYTVALSCRGWCFQLTVDGLPILSAQDEGRVHKSGGCGFLVCDGSMLADDFAVLGE
ncbi:ADP-ribosylglycohydrolase family protein [uncultured Oscillibacter sp.]|uniref:ADP-ribosylglycohydrolase family protein n=1 Tax=uncultured Oscillibacter sp. TaxID=876091 RepID=UPI002633E611|nr:ADP-ribosylglycohydrolase family protein [uncultured Oscillibacter sp.]